MRGDAEQQTEMLLALTPDQLVPDDHPIRRIKLVVERVLARLSPRFTAMYAERGRPSIPPEVLLKASLLIALYTVRSERLFCERLQYDFLFRWFLDINLGDGASTRRPFRRTAHDCWRDREASLLRRGGRGTRGATLLSDDHFTVDGTLIEAWASLKSYRPRDDQDPPAGGGRNAEVDFRGERRRRETHVSRTDPEALLYRKGKGQPAKLCYLGHVLTENRHGLVVDVELTQATGRAEREAAVRMLDRRAAGAGQRRADHGYDTADFVGALRARGVTAHVAQHTDAAARWTAARRDIAATGAASDDGSSSKRSSAG